MSKGEDTKARIIATATRLIAAQGYAATGLKQILEESETPRGSFYFHFPEGKEALGLAVVRAHAESFAAALDAVTLQAPDAVTGARLAVDALAQHFEASDCEAGCPISIVTQEMASRSPELQRAVRDAFAAWSHQIEVRLGRDGLEPEVARSRARAALAAIEGGLVLSRAYRDAGPLRDVADALPGLLAP